MSIVIVLIGCYVFTLNVYLTSIPRGVRRRIVSDGGGETPRAQWTLLWHGPPRDGSLGYNTWTWAWTRNVVGLQYLGVDEKRGWG